MSGTLALFLADDSFGVVFAVFVIGGVIALIAWGAHHQKKIRQNWLMFAQKNGLQVLGSTNRPTIQGWLGPVYITLNTVVRGSGKNRSTYTQYHATTNAPMPQGIVLYKEGFFSKVGKVFGGQDVQIGDPAIDQAFIIKAGDLLGTHDLLSLPPVKKALLYTITRHPGLRVQDRQLLVEHTGMTGDLPKIESIFADLSYLVQTFDAAYQELAGQRVQAPPPARPQPVPTRPAEPTRDEARRAAQLAAAEILQDRLAEVEKYKAAQVRRAGPEEDPAQRKLALSEMASVLHQYEEKLESGKVTPETPDPFARFRAPAQPTEDAFAEPHLGDAFDNPHLNAEVEPEAVSGASALSHYDPSHAFDSKPQERDTGQSSFAAFDAPPAGDAFKSPKPFEASQPATTGGEVAGSFEGLMGMLGASSLMSSQREEIIKRHTGKAWQVELVVERVDNTWGFDVPDDLRDGKTVEAHLKGSSTKLAVRYPKARNEEIGKLRSGAELKAGGTLAAWDDLFKKATLDAK
ncbi:MAG: hypothetical protein H6841_02685 [Planctomycetes bacterium]|nr:hypothetical protein [Planctomycetota bacterium]MCB9936342.1 hypothetical protein [Planctomycetota bacterium]